MPTQGRAIKLTRNERRELETFGAQGKKSARAITRARILRLAADGRKDKELTELVGVSRGTVHRVRKKYQQKAKGQIGEVLQEAPRSGRPLRLDSRVEAKVTRIACSEPPAGYGRWTPQRIADQGVKLEVTDAISDESVRRVLKKTNSNRG
jgi:putative transposase